MTSRLNLRSTRALIAASAFGVAAAHASLGVSVTRAQETAIRTGMGAAEVRQILGRPARIVTYGNSPGPSWNYEVVGSNGTTLFGIDFDPDGKVISAREYWMPTSGG
jgi:hypothetical protein